MNDSQPPMSKLLELLSHKKPTFRSISDEKENELQNLSIAFFVVLMSNPTVLGDNMYKMFEKFTEIVNPQTQDEDVLSGMVFATLHTISSAIHEGKTDVSKEFSIIISQTPILKAKLGKEELTFDDTKALSEVIKNN